jgi:2',3'-cyclic-nucleotide 2'-phosphodiesterase / 3'-nucleotidase
MTFVPGEYIKRLRVCFTSDTHGYLYPTDYTDRTEMPMGLMKLANAFKRDADTLIIDGGDTIQGSPFAGFLSRTEIFPHPVAQVMNLCGYDYVTLGNHDFNYGLEYLGRYLNALNARCLCANIRDRDGVLPILPYVIHTMANGLRVGIVGVSTHYMARWEKPETVERLLITPPVPAAAAALAEMKGRTDLTVCVYHGGFECDPVTGEKLTDSAENEACRLCRELNFDLVLTGHQHMPVQGARVGGAYAVQPAHNAANYCLVNVSFGGGKPLISSRLVPPAAAPLSGAAEMLMPLQDKAQAWLDTPIGFLSQPLPPGGHADMAINGSLIANLINLVQLDASGADISAASLANSVKGFDQAVTVRDVVSTYIYPNTLVVLRLSGAVLRQYLERSAAYFDYDNGVIAISPDFLRPKAEHYNYDYFSGMAYTFDLRRPVGERVVSMVRTGHAIMPEDTVTVCVNNYRASGTGGYGMLIGQPVVRDIRSDVSELMIAYIESRGQVQVDTRRYLTVIL